MPKQHTELQKNEPLSAEAPEGARRILKSGGGGWLGFSLLVFTQLVLLLGCAAEVNAAGGRLWLILGIGITLYAVVDIGMFFLVKQTRCRESVAVDNVLLAAQIEEKRTHYAEMTKQFECVRHFRHDIAKHANAVRGLLEAGRTEEAERYIDELLEEYDGGLCSEDGTDRNVEGNT